MGLQSFCTLDINISSPPFSFCSQVICIVQDFVLAYSLDSFIFGYSCNIDCSFPFNIQLYANRAILQQEQAIRVRYFAKEAGRPAALKGDGELKTKSWLFHLIIKHIIAFSSCKMGELLPLRITTWVHVCADRKNFQMNYRISSCSHILFDVLNDY